ncbi:MAG: hypothetical protein EAZ55_13470 [Cytophagales bacterium]|nr:MAG: hypothetical protein EAZ55_13470 [Cytophagales bacterium]
MNALQSMIMLVFLGLGILVNANQSLAQQDASVIGAKSIGMGQISTVLKNDVWSVYNQIGAIATLPQRQIGIAYENKYQLFEFQTFALVASTPLKVGALGISISRFGNSLYNEQKLGIGYGHRIEKVSLGIKLNYLQIQVQDMGSAQQLVGEIGGLAEITPQLFWGAYIYNFNLAKITGEYETIALPVVLRTGIGYQPLKSLLIAAEVERNLQQNTSIKWGVEYQLSKAFLLRTGIHTEPFLGHLGMGFRNDAVHFDYAISLHERLGFSHQISAHYKF